MRWLSKGLSLERLVVLWEQVINFVKFKFQIFDCKYKKQAGKAQEIVEKLENTEIILKIYVLSHIYKTMNGDLLNFKLQGKKNHT